MCILGNQENSAELFPWHPDGGSLGEIVHVEASPGWHLVEEGCCLVGVFLEDAHMGPPSEDEIGGRVDA